MLPFVVQPQPVEYFVEWAGRGYFFPMLSQEDPQIAAARSVIRDEIGSGQAHMRFFVCFSYRVN
jgi:hypothetical protein